MRDEQPSRAVQMWGSLIAAALIVVATIFVVTARIGPAGVDSEAREERVEELEERDAEAAEDASRRGRTRGRSGRD